MHLARIASLFPLPIKKKRWHVSGLFIFVYFIVASQIASLCSPSYIWDDLVWYWTYHVDGTKALFDFLTQVGHPAFWPFIDFAYRVFEEHATFPTTIIAIVFHATNSILIFHLMGYLNAGRVTAFVAFVLYLVSPHYFNRGTVSHYFYDVFMFFFLFSIYLGAPNQKSRFTRFAVAPVFQILYFGLPTLVMLEPLRLAVHWELCKRNNKRTINSIGFYWIVAFACAVTAFVAFKPTGYYAGYNDLKFNISHIFSGILDYLLYLPKTLAFHAGNGWTVLMQPLDWPFVFLLMAIAFITIHAMPEPEKKILKRNTMLLLFLGTTLFFLGSVPYVLAGRSPEPHDFNSRLFFISGLGLVMVISVAVGMIHSERNRILFMSALVGFFLVSGFQQAKAYMYDHIVRQSVISGLRLGENTIGTKDQDLFVVLVADPSFWELLTQRNMITNVEFSVPMNIHVPSGRGKWFVYIYDARDFSSPDYFSPPRECLLAAHDRHPCPAKYVVAKFQLDQDKAFANFSFLQLFYQSLLKDKPASIGRLEFTTDLKPMDTDEIAVRWYRKLAEDGTSVAQNALGLMYLEGFASVPQDDRQAFEWFHRAAEQGILDARLNLGVMYLEGRGVERNEEIAVQLISSAAQEGNARAEYNLGVLHEQGHVLPKSETEAFKWYLKAAEQNNASAQTHVGLMYARGRGTERNDVAASQWLLKATEKREMIAQYALGIMLVEGRGVTQNNQLAEVLLKESAYQGYPQALFSLGYLYEHGIGVPKDMGESYFWYRLAYLHGDSQTRKTAVGVSAVVGRSLSAAEKRELNQRIDQWRPAKPKKLPSWQH